jgi:hypothetical protein
MLVSVQNIFFKALRLVIGFLIFMPANAQTPLRISVFNEATAMPFTRFVSVPVHPGLQIGTEFNYKNKKHHHLYQTLKAGYINTEFGYDYKFGFGLNLKTALGVGYMHTFTTQQEYRLINGHYEQKPDKGNSRVMPSFSLGLGFRLKKGNTSPELFTNYQTWLEYPYSPGFIPLMAHTNLHVGFKFFIAKKTN